MIYYYLRLPSITLVTFPWIIYSYRNEVFQNSLGIRSENILTPSPPSDKTKQLLWAFPLSIKKSEYRVTFHFHSYSKEVFQNPFGFCSENIWTVPSNLKSNNLDEPRFPLVLKKDWINGKPYCFILLQERCSEKRSENGEIHSGISE